MTEIVSDNCTENYYNVANLVLRIQDFWQPF